MSINYVLYRASAHDIAQLKEVPATLTTFTNRGEDFVYVPPPRGFLSRLFGRGTAPRHPPIEWSARQDGDEEALDWAAEGLHFLFTGTHAEGEAPASSLMCDAYAIGDSWTPGWLLEPEQVARFAEYLLAVTPDELRQRYDPVRMDALEVLPVDWTQRGEAGRDSLLDYFERLCVFIAAANDTRSGIVYLLT